jgi:hypothetical protein
MIHEKQPAQIYDLNMLASVLGRVQVKKMDGRTSTQIRELADVVISVLEDKTKPPVPHTEKHLLEEATKFSLKLRRMLNSERAASVLLPTQKNKISSVLSVFEEACIDLNSDKSEQLITTQQIEEMFQFYGIWKNGYEEMEEDLDRWDQRQHPAVPVSLKIPISVEETKRLIEVMKQDILDIESPLVASTYFTNQPENYHLFWSLTESNVDYVTPATYGLDTQLSFDLPHNVAHLVHLSKIQGKGVQGYVDDMATRAFFEAVAVFSENQIVQKLRESQEGIQSIHRNLNPNRKIEPEVLQEWINKDRSFEFRLRASRLLADLLAVEGASLAEIIDIVSKTVELPYEVAKAEVVKYFPWTGLGAIYTLGYRYLEQAGISGVNEILKENPPTTWDEFNTAH